MVGAVSRRMWLPWGKEEETGLGEGAEQRESRKEKSGQAAAYLALP